MTTRARHGWAWVLALLAAALPGSVRAAEDAGTRSVFAAGAGNRALGMGSAFVAAADDASAILWNPAGLGLVPRAELEAVQTSDLGLGFRQVYASLAVPSWRWGTAALSFRSFGVDGIERRDDRNALLGEFSDSETEIAVGYGRLVGRALSLGGAVKLQRQSLAGTSAGGLGLDLGVRVLPAAVLGASAPWASQWTWALAVRNAVEPSLRLDREAVRDPLTIRTGLAWQAPMYGVGGVLAEVDLETSRGMDSRPHLGVEYRVLPAVALRAGSDGALTAGAGFRWRDVGVEYAFRDNPIAPEHRVGVSLSFGAAVEESRLAARRREDEALQQRLADGSRERQERQIADLLERARDARSHGLYDDALQSLAVLQTLAPGEARTAELESACLRDKAARLEQRGDVAAAAVTYELALAATPGDSAAAAGAARCRTEGDRRAERSNQMRQRFGAAMDAFAAGDLPRARGGFAAVLQEAPRDSDAALMLRRTEQAMSRRAGDLVDEAGRALRAGRLAEAETALDQASALDPEAPGLATARASLARTRQLADEARLVRAPVPAQTAGPAAPRADDRQLDRLYRQGQLALRQGRQDDALRYWELVWSVQPGYRQVRDYLKREYLTRGMEAFASGRLEEAVSRWEKALELDPGDERARGYLSRAQKQLARSREILGMNR